MAGIPVIRTGPTVAVGGGVSVITGSNKTTYANSAYLKFSQGFNNEAYQSENSSGVWACGDQISHVLTDDVDKGPDHVAAIGESVFAIGTTHGALGFYIEHNGGANPRWHHGSRTDYNGGFRWAIQDPTAAPDSGVAAGAGDTISFGGVVFDFSFSGNPENMFEGLASAMCWVGREISIDGGTSTPGNELDFAGISARDRLQTRSGTAPLTGNFFGHVVDLGGLIQLNGPVQIGNADNVTVTHFLDKDIACQWSESPVNDKFYRLDIVGSATTVIFGDAATPLPVSISGGSTRRWVLDSATQAPAAFSAYGCSFKKGRAWKLGATSLLKDCLLQDITDVTMSAGADINGSTLIDAPLHFTAPPVAADIKDVTFRDCATNAIHITDAGAGTLTLDGVKFSGNNNDIEFSHSTGNITIQLINGADTPSYTVTGAGTVTPPSTAVTLEVTVLDDATGLPIQDAHVLLLKESDKSELLNASTNASGIASTSINYDADTNILGWVRQMDLAGIDYVPKNISGTYTASGFSATVRLQQISL